MSNNSPYNYPITVACKIIIRKDNLVLFTREPKDHTWMPGRLSLPGGKFLLKESISEGLERKIKDEAGIKCRIKGLFKIINILMSDRTVYHYIFIADYVGGETTSEGHYTSGLK